MATPREILAKMTRAQVTGAAQTVASGAFQAVYGANPADQAFLGARRDWFVSTLASGIEAQLLQLRGRTPAPEPARRTPVPAPALGIEEARRILAHAVEKFRDWRSSQQVPA